MLKCKIKKFQKIRSSLTGFTLIELMISISISLVTAGAIYFSLNTALESWGYSKDQLALQKVLNDVMEEMASGSASDYGVRDSLEIVGAGGNRIDFIPPWTDDTHTVFTDESVYVLNRKLKAGTSVPISEIKLPETESYQIIPVRIVEEEKEAKISRLQLGVAAVPGSELKFTYHPDYESNSDVIESIWWDQDTKQVYSRYGNIKKVLSENSFDIKIVDMKMKYYDGANNLITDSQWVKEDEFNSITGVEFFLKAQTGQYTKSLISFIHLRNAPLCSGTLPLRKGTHIVIPDSYKIHTFFLNNISGVGNSDTLTVQAVPEYGKSWRIEITFSQIGLFKPKIEKYTIEYPIGNTVYTEYPRMDIDIGLNLLALDSGGLYDYDDDEDTDDVILLEGKVTLEVEEMDIEGAGLFLRP